MINILIRVSGILGLVLGVAAFQSNKHKGIVMAKMGSEAAFTVQATVSVTNSSSQHEQET